MLSLLNCKTVDFSTFLKEHEHNTDHEKDGTTIHRSDGFYETRGGSEKAKKTTRGLKLLVEWKDGSTSWLPLKEIKETNAVEVAQYARDNDIIEEPAFAWWAPFVLKKLRRLIKLSKSRHIRKGYKFGIRIPILR